MVFNSQIQQNAIDMAEFELKMLPPLINMAEDRVPNVRLVVAKCLLNCVRNGECRGLGYLRERT